MKPSGAVSLSSSTRPSHGFFKFLNIFNFSKKDSLKTPPSEGGVFKEGGAGGAVSSEELPLLPLRELVLFPNTTLPLFITYKAGIAAVDEALKGGRRLFAACLRDTADNAIYPVGTVARVTQYLKLSDGSYRVVLQGEYRARLNAILEKRDPLMVFVAPISAEDGGDESVQPVVSALMRSVQKSFTQYAEFTKKAGPETLLAVEKSESAEYLSNLICHAIHIKPEKKAELLGIMGVQERLEKLLETLEIENEIFGFILREQLKEINKELGEDAGASDEAAEIEKILEAKNPGAEVLEKARKEIARLRKLQQLSPESGVIRAYLEWLSDLPWNETSGNSVDLVQAEKILNEDHYAMKKAKERILEFVAVRKLAGEQGRKTGGDEEEKRAEISQGTVRLAIKGPILCFVGPPGTGKTSLCASIARCLGRNFVRMSLGGVRDEAEIRGHRKTYVGALPGKIIQSMRKAGSVNPVFLLDEIDKISSDVLRGDPASALLEVLDPEQNSAFMDHYLEVPYDLSKVLFIATANSLHTIPYPLIDRMEIIEIAGYGENEKLAIAKKFLIPKQLASNGLADANIVFRDDAVREIIRHWTMESGVRGLEREIARCVRRLARRAVDFLKADKASSDTPEIETSHPESGEISADPSEAQDNPADILHNQAQKLKNFKKVVKKADLGRLLNKRKYKDDVVFKEAHIGVSYGLAWTETGGVILPVETICFAGSGDLIFTGNVGDVMKESGRIALSYIRSVQPKYGFKQNMSKTDFHIHVPEGAIPKDGPSAGITLAASLLSSLIGKPPARRVVMTGELTLTGRVLPIGGLKEKLLAAVRSGMEWVLLPAGNQEDWDDVDADIRGALSAEFVEKADDAFRALFEGGDAA